MNMEKVLNEIMKKRGTEQPDGSIIFNSYNRRRVVCDLWRLIIDEKKKFSDKLFEEVNDAS